jgi:hypothetical protein
VISITIHTGVVGMIELIHDPVFDQWFDAVSLEFIKE